MISLDVLFQAERIKWRRSWATVAAVLCPACLVGFLFLIFWSAEIQVSKIGPGYQVWYQIAHAAWNAIFLPITVALVCQLSWEQEEEAGAWRHLLLQPVPRTHHFLAKLMSHAALLLVAQLVLSGLVLAGSFLVAQYLLYLDLGPRQWRLLAGLGATSFLAGLPLLTLHTWFATRIRGVGPSLVLALVGSLLTALLAGLRVGMAWSPWALATSGVRIAMGATKGAALILGCSMGLAMLLATLGTFDFARREEQR